ncbi:CPBP family intramembrane glutamic endopeptidase [Erythrobacter sp. WG]|uniref:CPBP family intramembrane glutamic endopeptidase n=1 Tax=Erythrobacter sp. WG TaxID=2985510 RepID=UPI0022713AFE|nr:CPBP family intramembrane glutamic endopeptidase [Erythrobacter sp. WG]MCX9147458.1 CPBP family intramembrane metalloprotease [Erythrobacter sp. WG]
MNEATVTAPRLIVERKAADFPFYADRPPTISGAGWLMIMAATVIGFAALGTPMPFEDNILTGWIRGAIFVGLPLLALALAAPGRWQAIFRRVGFGDVLLMFGIAIFNIIVTLAVGALLKTYGTVSANAGVADAASLEGVRLVSFFAKVGLQMLGEELITILPFLALLTWLHSKAGMGRNGAVLAAWLLSAIIFGLLHLPTYNWNIAQCVLVIGSARLVLTLAYVWTKNIWVSTGAHVINDWTLIASTVFLAPLAAAA